MLEGRRAIVTGASRGIGAAIARALDAHSVRAVLVARDGGALAELAASLAGAVPYVADLSDRTAPARVVEFATTALGGPIDILCNNAGVFALRGIEATDDAALDAALAVNLAAPVRLLRAVLPAMRARAAGHVVTVGSVADRVALAGNSVYAATKFGARALHEVVRAELRGSGVRATLVSPGPTDTPLWDPHEPDARPDLTPRARMLRPEYVADAVVWVLTRPADVNVDELRLTRA